MPISKGGGSGGGTGGAPVSCLLALDGAMDIRQTGNRSIFWDALYDNAVSFNTLPAIPTGLGLSFLFNGTSPTITTTAAGTWAFACQLERGADATWAGLFSYGTAIARPSVWSGLGAASTSSLVFTDVLTLPTACAFSPYVGVITAATSNPYTTIAYLSIVRLG